MSRLVQLIFTGKRIEKIREHLDEAGKLYQQEQYAIAGIKIVQAQRQMVRAIGQRLLNCNLHRQGISPGAACPRTVFGSREKPGADAGP